MINPNVLIRRIYITCFFKSTGEIEKFIVFKYFSLSIFDKNYPNSDEKPSINTVLPLSESPHLKIIARPSIYPFELCEFIIYSENNYQIISYKFLWISAE